MSRAWPSHVWQVTVTACLLAQLDLAHARVGRVRGGTSNGGPPPEGYGELDETTFVVVLCFVGLGVVFCVCGALCKRGVTRLAEMDARAAARRALRELEAGGGWNGDGRFQKLVVGDEVQIQKNKDVAVVGVGAIRKVSSDGTRFHVKWPPKLSSTYTYRPYGESGPLIRAKRKRPGPKRGVRREE
jgi:hypothetical protein